MDTMLKYLTEGMNSGNFFIPILVLIIVFAFHLKKIFEFFDGRKSVKIKQLQDALSCDLIEGETRDFLQERLVIEQFRRATGIQAEKPMREAIIEAHQRTQGTLFFHHFKRAQLYLVYEDQQLKIKLSLFDRAYYYIAFFCYFFLVLCVVFLLLILFFQFIFKQLNIGDAIHTLVIALIFSSGLLLGFFDLLSIISAKKIQKLITISNPENQVLLPNTKNHTE